MHKKYLIFLLSLLKVATCKQQFLSEDVALYINRQIDKVLLQNPAKDILDLKINAEFNEQRNELQNAKFQNTINVTEDAEYQTDLKRRSFAKFVMDFEEVANQLDVAFVEIDNLQKNKLIPLSAKFKALTLKNKLQDSRTVKEAESNLKKYQNFKQANLADSDSPYLVMAEENKKYFEDIIKELQKLSICGSQKAENSLLNLAENPEKLNNMNRTLNKLVEKNEDYEVYEIDAADLFDAFLGL